MELFSVSPSEIAQDSQIETMECDVLIVGAGPAGLSAAIRLKQLAPEREIIVVEKGAEVGAHILSGACIEPRALNELIPDWKEKGAPLNIEAKEDRFLFMTKRSAFRLPTPPQMKNEGNYIISLGNFARWLAKQAEALGVQVFPGFAAAKAVVEGDMVQGILTGAFGISKGGEKKASYQPPMWLKAKYTLFAEGCRGSLSGFLMEHFGLREGASPQTYAIGLKEIWEIPAEKHKLGLVEHSIGWPLDIETYGGSFVYHAENRQVALGLAVGLDYKNPYLDPFLEFQKFKTHPHIAKMLEGGRRLSYGARALNEGGLQAIPRLYFNGGALIGDAAGFLNTPKIKGTHTSMKSGMLAAEAVAEALFQGRAGDELVAYAENFKTSWLYQELYAARNVRPAFSMGLIAGLAYAAFDTFFMKGKAPWTFRWKKTDRSETAKAKHYRPIAYAKPDGRLTFDRMSSVFLSNTNHEEDQPAHLRLKDASIPIEVNLPEYAEPAQRYCPAGVYEVVEEGGKKRFQINAQNCVHCKTCDIKDPSNNIVWTVPEGGGGPNYPNM